MTVGHFGTHTENICLGCHKHLTKGGPRYRAVYCNIECHDQYRKRYDQPPNAQQRLQARRNARKQT